METAQLESIGLSKAEIKVYLALLKLGATTTGSLAKETDLRKSTIYDSLHRLIEKGLVSYSIQHYVKYFEATEPERILDFVAEQKKELAEREQKVQSMLPELRALRGLEKPKAEAHVFLGLEGFKTMRQDILKHSNGELLLLGSISREDKVMPFFWKQWTRERIKQKIKLRVLHKRATETPIEQSKFMQLRFLPKEIDNPVVINIYGDRVVSLIWKEKYPLCFMLINKEISAAYKRYFELLWRQARK